MAHDIKRNSEKKRKLDEMEFNGLLPKAKSHRGNDDNWNFLDALNLDDDSEDDQKNSHLVKDSGGLLEQHDLFLKRRMSRLWLIWAMIGSLWHLCSI